MNLYHWFLLILLSMIWGSSFLFIELALVDFVPLQIVFLRIAIAAFALSAFVYIRGKKFPLTVTLWRDCLIMSIINNVVPYCLIAWGQTEITSSVASIMNSTVPIFTVLIAHVFTQDERLSWAKFLGVLIGFIGVCFMMYPTLDYGMSLSGVGQLAVLLAAFSYAMAAVWGKRFSGYDPDVSSALMLLCATLVLLPLVVLFNPEFPYNPGFVSVSSILFMAVMSTAFAYILYFKILKSAGATNMSLVTFLLPISAIILGVVFLDERLNLYHIVGMFGIFVGLVCIDGRIFQKKEVSK